ncbi:MAG: bifunctional folylpolyglutamate synthase/dihydrofolate synthase [Bacteroidales bacterium]|nr:bifunctional folylpolyglutamate synthase/dihydrofolate synthase [Bacteroidales bacterium]
MNYTQTLAYLYNSLPVYQRIGAAAYKKDLNNTIALLAGLGNPEKKLKSIHIAGTNGKGSVSHNLASIFQEAGFKTGLYTSPHLKDFRERIRINGKKISKNYIVDFVEKNKQLFEKIQPSFFEMTVAMAFSYFAENKVDIAIVETGMGGRLDSTNVLNPDLSIITNISWDHTQFLGDTLAKIATEKAGIIKQDIPIIIGETQPETTAVFVQKAKEMNAPLYFADKQIDIKETYTEDTASGFLMHFDVFDNKGRALYKDIQTPLTGDYQIKNFKSVLLATQLFQHKLDTTAVTRGIANCIKNTQLQGRWQVLSKQPLIIADTGHNQAGLSYIFHQLQTIKHEKLHIVFGVVNDKDLGKILPLLPKDAKYYFCQAQIPRALEARMLQQNAKQYGLEGKTYSSVKNALRRARYHATANDLIFVGGSTFVVAEVL